MLSTLRNFARKNLAIRKLVGYYLASSGMFDWVFKRYKLSPSWQQRIDYALACPDNTYIPRVEHAGEIRSGEQCMHNGLKIHLGSYYGPEYTRMLELNKGVHEPQEERVFMEAIKTLGEGSLMVEMGAFWGFYSMWFNSQLKGVNFLVEPDNFNLGQGRRNFRLNGLKGTFVQAFVSDHTDANLTTVSVDGLIRIHKIDFIHMLHSDIQGYEFQMLQGAVQAFEKQMIGYVFISTHSNELHEKCLRFLKEKDFVIIADVNLDDTYSEDGLIAARAPYFHGIGPVDVSRRSKN
jgi:hypothetical protein